MAAWIIPCNEKYYKHREAFANLNTIDWRQSTNVEIGDEVYIYVGQTVGAILYKCEVLDVNIIEPNNNDVEYNIDGKLKPAGKYMKLKLLETYPEDKYKLKDLLEHGLKTVQGPSKVSTELLSFLISK